MSSFYLMKILIDFKVKGAIEDLIKKHQRIPGTIVQALLERFYTPAHVKQD